MVTGVAVILLEAASRVLRPGWTRVEFLNTADGIRAGEAPPVVARYRNVHSMART